MRTLESQYQQQENGVQKAEPFVFRVDRTHYDGLVPEFISKGLERVLLEYPECNVQSLYEDSCEPLIVEIQISGGIIMLIFEKCICIDAVFFSNE